MKKLQGEISNAVMIIEYRLNLEWHEYARSTELAEILSAVHEAGLQHYHFIRLVVDDGVDRLVVSIK